MRSGHSPARDLTADGPSCEPLATATAVVLALLLDLRPHEALVAPAPRPADASGWHIGQNVEHAKFGEGVVLNMEGSGADARVQVKFRKAGSKWLALEYAKLTAV